jgi:hypothetical protein
MFRLGGIIGEIFENMLWEGFCGMFILEGIIGEIFEKILWGGFYFTFFLVTSNFSSFESSS